jgi:hypothetical protein
MNTRQDALGSAADHRGDRPVFVLGAPRSGTTLLYKSLCLHPDAAYISNWVRRRPEIPQLALLNRVARRFPDTQRRVWFGGGADAYVYGSPRSALQRAFPMPDEGEPVFRRAGIPEAVDGADPARPPVDALRTAFRRISRSSGAGQVVSKRIGHNRRIPLLLAAFPDARFVEVVRDGRAVAHSLSKVDWWPDTSLWWNGGHTPKEWAASGGDPWELRARSWVMEIDAIAQGLKSVPVEQVRSIRYEDLVVAPHQTLLDVAAFAGLRRDEGWQRRLAALTFRDGNDAWQRHLSPVEIETVERIQHDALRARGYV